MMTMELHYGALWAAFLVEFPLNLAEFRGWYERFFMG